MSHGWYQCNDYLCEVKWLSFFLINMSKEKLIPYSHYFDEYPTDNWSYSSFIRYAFNKRLLPPNPVKVYNYKYKKCLDFIEQKYDSLKCSKAISLKKSFKVSIFSVQMSITCQQHSLALSQVNTIRNVLAPLWVSLACCYYCALLDKASILYRVSSRHPGFPRRTLDC